MHCLAIRDVSFTPLGGVAAVEGLLAVVEACVVGVSGVGEVRVAADAAEAVDLIRAYSHAVFLSPYKVHKLKQLAS